MKKRSLQEELGRLSCVLMSNKSAGSRFAWNPYFPPGVSLPEEEDSEIAHCVRQYKALVSMCDYNLGRVLDLMDHYGLGEPG